MTQPGSELYNSHALKYAEAIEDNIYNALHERPSTLAMLPEKLSGLKILDAGCGPGVYAKHLAENGAEVTAVDSSEAMIKHLRKQLGDKVHCYVHDLRTPLAQEKSQSFDLIVCPVTIHYIEKLKLFYTEMFRLLKPGGTFVFSTHHPFVDWEHSEKHNYYEQEQLTQTWNTIGEDTSVSFYRRPFETLINTALEVGFQIEKISEKGSPSDLIKNKNEETWKKLNTKPQFVFFKMRRP